MQDEAGGEAAMGVVSIKRSKRWHGALTRDRGRIAPTLGNASAILLRDESWDGVFAFDELRGRARKMKEPPHEAMDRPSRSAARSPYVTDVDVDFARTWCERQKHLDHVAFSRQTMNTAIRLAAKKKAFHPVRDYLETCAGKWDKKKRIDTWLTDLAQVDDSPYVRAVGSKWLISAVARAFNPGEQVDHVLVIEGETRGGKSTTIQSLIPDPEWFLDTTIELGTKDAMQVISGKWIVEFAEMGSMTRSEASRIKAFITSKCDTYRKAYAENEIDQKRTCVFVGTVNPENGGEYLKDETGGGRFWPVKTKSTIHNRINREAIVKARDQLWGEAVARWRAGEAWHLIDPELIRAAEIEQRERLAKDPWEARALAWLSSGGREEKGVSVAALVKALGGDENAVGDCMRGARVLTSVGWRKADRPSREGERIRLYRPLLEAQRIVKRP